MTTESEQTCPEFSRYMEEFRRRLRHALDENKWFLSERSGHDVGESAATRDFLEHHFDRFAGEVRSSFCEHTCSRQKKCPLALFIGSLPATSKALTLHASKFPKSKHEPSALG
jgi:hypothetical protein